jgi:hypothetical protein
VGRRTSYTDRLRQRPVQRAVSRRSWPPRRLAVARAVRLLAVLSGGAEAGHLAAVVRWPGGAGGGAYHVLAGAALGLVTVSLAFGPSRRAMVAAGAVALAAPGGWLVGTLVAASPYQDVPVAAAIALTGVELVLAVLLAAFWRAAPQVVT